MHNQVETNSYDQFVWRDERTNLHNRIKTFSSAHNIVFSNTISEKIVIQAENDIIIHMWLFDPVNLSELQKLNHVCQTHGKIILVITDNIIEDPNLTHVKFFSYPELLGVCASYDDIKFDNHEPSKLYNCFIQRVDPVRQSWFYLLHQHNLLDQGYVSFLLFQLLTYSNFTDGELFDYNHKHFGLDQVETFNESYKQLKDMVPYRNFKEIGNLIPLILDSKYSLILETAATADNQGFWFFSEKTLRDLQFPTISLLFAQAGAVQKLKNLGLQMPPVLDALDNLPWQRRQQALIHILVNDLVDFNQDLSYNQAMHNKDLLSTWKKRYQQKDFFEGFFEEALSL